ncbi:LOG family protein [Risungbinella massiliensis]|uniref:LOG family protein n=1 Tax=Risungbinella massiliensis TaxID=1329796 RepID=UPI0005CC02B4|nr:TIGR00730 family Rossman fold protein [Risungbinella massiliensis]
MKRICVFAGSNPGNEPIYREVAEQLGKHIAQMDYELVYGGSRIGLMGSVANAALQHKGTVIGIMPTGLFAGEMVHPDLTKLMEVKDMHERKAQMRELSDAFIALPGGLGTFEEILEMVSWGQLGIHQKPVGLLNINGFYEPLLAMVEQAIQAGFIPANQRELLVIDNDPTKLIEKLQHYQPPSKVNKWSELTD